MAKGTWYDVVFHIKYASDNTGFIKLWVNGVVKIDVTNVGTAYNTINQENFKWGVYFGTWPNSTGGANEPRAVGCEL